MQAQPHMQTGQRQGSLTIVAPDVACLMQPVVNVYFIGPAGAGDRDWVLVDAGLPFTAGQIASAAEERFGAGARPSAIVMTHGHFDHIGALRELAERWDAPVYAHELELPYLTGRSAYPPGDPGVGGGGMAALSFLYPRGPIDLGMRVQPLPPNGTVPGLPGWRWIHTPGHSPGHVSYFRESDRALVAGDAFVTTKQESAIAALSKPLEIHGPPAYFTPDWRLARCSVETLALLRPAVAATGHGRPMRGERLQHDLERLSREFEQLAVPEHGRYVNQPAIADESGVISIPPPISSPVPAILTAAAALFVAIGVAKAVTRE